MAQRIERTMKQTCYFCTKFIFTAGHTSTGRVESTQSRIKGKNVLKMELKKAALVESVERVLQLADSQDIESTGDIRNLITKGKKWSRFVDNIWKDNQNEVYKLRISSISPSENGKTKYEIDDTNGNRKHVVFLFDDLPPTCECPKFCSMRIPCEGISIAIGKTTKNLFVESNLMPRWRISNHPLYKVAMAKMGLIPNENEESTAAASMDIDMVAKMNVEAFSKIQHLKKQEHRVARLVTTLDELVKVAATNETAYKHAMSTTLTETNALKSYLHAGKLRSEVPFPFHGVLHQGDPW